MSLIKLCKSVNLYPHQIHRKDVDNFKPGKSVSPKCVLLVEWDLEGPKPVRLRYKINFIGAKEPNFYNLRLNTWKGSILVVSLDSCCVNLLILCTCDIKINVTVMSTRPIVGLVMIRGLG